ncbi:MAG: DUF5606 domain-containing protein [Rikenellaceae bacterium]
MELRDILSIAGQPGLYKFVAQSNHGIIVESLAEGKRSNVSGSAKVSSMGEIAIFTEGEDIPLSQVFENIFTHTSGAEAISHKSTNDELKAFFAAVLPEYDKERVHVSDIKKVVQWYNILINNGFTEFKIEDTEAEQEQTAE